MGQTVMRVSLEDGQLAEVVVQPAFLSNQEPHDGLVLHELLKSTANELINAGFTVVEDSSGELRGTFAPLAKLKEAVEKCGGEINNVGPAKTSAAR